MTFGEKIKQLLYTFEISPKELSDITGIHVSSIRSYVYEEVKKPRYENIRKIENALGVNLKEYYPKDKSWIIELKESEKTIIKKNKTTSRIRLRPFDNSIQIIENFKKNFDQNIKAKNISIKQLSKQCGISLNTLYYYLRGDGLPNVKTAIKIADYFQVSLDQLTGYECLEKKYDCEEVDMGIRVNMILQEANVSITELAKLTGVSRGCIEKYILGKVTFQRLDAVMRMAYVLEISIDTFVGHKKSF